MELFYRKIGQGAPLIIVHGLYGSSDNWLSIGKALSKHFTVYLIDQRNHGESPHSDLHDYPSMRDDLIQFMNYQNIKKAVLIGHSMGGKTVMFLAEHFPERVQALIVIDISPTPYNKDSHPGQALIHKRILDGLMEVDFSHVKSRKDVDRQLAEKIDNPQIRNFLLKNLKRLADKKYVWKLNVPVIQKNLPKILGGLDPEKYSGGEEIAGFPSLFIRGEKSDYITDDDIQVIHQIFPGARVTTIPGAGHWLHSEQPALLVKTIRYFL